MKTITRYIDCIRSDIDFIVGGNAQENHDIIDSADDEDYWFHVSQYPSCHVICKIPDGIKEIKNKKILLKIAKQGAIICKENSKYKSHKHVEIVYTQIKNITKLDTPGSVSISNGKSIFI